VARVRADGWVRYQLSEPVTVVDYALSSANDSAERDPRTGSSRARTTAATGPRSTRRPARTSPSASRPSSTASPNPGSYEYYRLNITANHGDGLIQLAELQLSDGDTTPPPATDMKAFATSGPVNGRR
jgi:hypothetical protein